MRNPLQSKLQGLDRMSGSEQTVAQYLISCSPRVQAQDQSLRHHSKNMMLSRKPSLVQESVLIVGLVAWSDVSARHKLSISRMR